MILTVMQEMETNFYLIGKSIITSLGTVDNRNMQCISAG